MRLSALVKSADHVCCRYRLRAFQAGFAAAGHSLECHARPQSFWRRLGIGRGMEKADAVILQRMLLSPLELSLLRRTVRKLIFDFDDAVWLRDSYSPKGIGSPRRRRRFTSLLQRCEAVVAGNSFLAEHAARCADVPIRIIPTCVDVSRYSLARHDRPADVAELVWIGSSSTLQGLEAIEPLLERIGECNRCTGEGRGLRLRLKLICDRFLKLRELPVVAARWSEATEAAELAAADIGISWVPDDPWSRGKCGLKVLQYMASGLPVVANPVGVQAELVRHGETGLLARTDDEWVEAIQLLASDPELRRRMGQAGRALVEEKFSVATGSRLWLSLLQRMSVQRISA